MLPRFGVLFAFIVFCLFVTSFTMPFNLKPTASIAQEWSHAPATDTTLRRSVTANNQSAHIVVNISLCKGEGYFAAGRPRFVSGVYQDTLMAIGGRDSIVTTKLYISSCKLAE